MRTVCKGASLSARLRIFPSPQSTRPSDQNDLAMTPEGGHGEAEIDATRRTGSAVDEDVAGEDLTGGLQEPRPRIRDRRVVVPNSHADDGCRRHLVVGTTALSHPNGRVRACNEDALSFSADHRDR